MPNWASLHAEVNAWRGQCLHLFARAEAAVSEALLYLAKQTPDEVSLPLLVGARYDEVERVLSKSTSAAAEPARKTMLTFRGHDRLRVFLCHGLATVLVDQRGSWHAAFDLLALRNGAEARDELYLSKSKALALQRSLQGDSHRLCQRLAALAGA